jgi:hypothetical protein
MSGIILSRRSFLGGLIAAVAAPAIVRVSSIMPIKALRPDYLWVPTQAYFDLSDSERKLMDRLVLPSGWAPGDFVLLKNEAGAGMIVAENAASEIYLSGSAEWRFPQICLRGLEEEYVEPPTSWE